MTGRRAPALVLHPMLAQARAMTQIIAAFGDRLDASACDLPGHGHASDWDPARDYGDVAVEQACAGLVQPAHLIGHSYGAYVALRLAVERPELVLSLSLYEPVFFAAAAHSKPAELARHEAVATGFMQPLEHGDFDVAARGFFKYWGGGARWDGLRTDQQTYITARMPLVAASQSSIVVDSGGVWPRLARVDVPCLLMSGGRSPAIVGSILDALEMQLPDARRVLFEEGGHMAPLTHAPEIAAKILDFLSL